jgi:hypothetical protein
MLLLALLNRLDNAKTTLLFNNTSNFLSTSTAGYSLSTLDLSDRLVSNYEYNTNYLKLVTKPYLTGLTKPYTLAGSANAQIDQVVTIDAITNDTFKLVFVSNYASANVSVVLSSDETFTNRVTYTFTGVATANYKTTMFETVVLFKTSIGTITGTPDLSKIIRARVSSINSTSTNRVTITYLSNANNYLNFAGQVWSNNVCCNEDPVLKLTQTLEDITRCGNKVGKKVTDSTGDFTFTTPEEDIRLLSVMSGSPLQLATFTDLEGYTKNQLVNPVANVSGKAQITLTSNLSIENISFGCDNMLLINATPAIIANPDTYLSSGECAYDTATGIVYFNSSVIGQYPEIIVTDSFEAEILAPDPLKLSPYMETILQTVSESNKRRTAIVKKMQFAFPEYSSDAGLQKQSFTGTPIWTKVNDIIIATEI